MHAVWCCRAQHTYETEVRPIFEAAGLAVVQMVTEYSGHATEIVANLDLESTDVLAVVGGDGTMFEALAVRPSSTVTAPVCGALRPCPRSWHPNIYRSRQ